MLASWLATGQGLGMRSGEETGSPKVILLAKSEMCMIDVRHEPEKQGCQRTGSCETDFASSIKSADDPTSFTSVGNEADLIGSLSPLPLCLSRWRGPVLALDDGGLFGGGMRSTFWLGGNEAEFQQHVPAPIRPAGRDPLDGREP
jgi:hypothetical protein